MSPNAKRALIKHPLCEKCLHTKADRAPLGLNCLMKDRPFENKGFIKKKAVRLPNNEEYWHVCHRSICRTGEERIMRALVVARGHADISLTDLFENRMVKRKINGKYCVTFVNTGKKRRVWEDGTVEVRGGKRWDRVGVIE